MRVAYVCADPGVGVFGRKGASVHAQAVLREFEAMGAEVHLLAVRTGDQPPSGLGSVQVHPLPDVTRGEPAAREISARASDAAVAGVLDDLHAEAPFDLVYERYSLWGRTATAWAAARGVPSVLEVNAPLVQEQAEHRHLIDRAGAETVARRALSAATAVVCVSDDIAAWARTLARDPGRVHTVPNGVDVDLVTPSPRPPTPATGAPFTVGFVGTLKPWHGVETLVAALGILATDDRSYRLLLVGDGPRADALLDQAREAGVDDLVEATGAVDHDAVPALLHRIDVATAPYPAAEGFYFSPLKVYEYLAAGLPVVASRAGQVDQALDGGRLGVLVEPGDPAALAEAIASLRSDLHRRTVLGRAARERAARAHTWRGVVVRSLGLAGVGV